MGMYDTFHLQDRGRALAVQSKQFACMLGEYRLGDFVMFEHDPPAGVATYVEDHKEDWQDPACPIEWVVLLLVGGCFVDAYITPDEANARATADIMARLWTSPERQADAFKRHAKSHYERREALAHTVGEMLNLLRDYAERNAENAHPIWRALRHDFDKESWDLALARLIANLPDYAAHLPDGYRVALALDAAGNRQDSTKS